MDGYQQTYTYDALSRLQSVNDTGLGTPVSAPVASTQYYVYDRHGNRAVLDPSVRMFGNATPSIPGNTAQANYATAVEGIFPQNRWNGLTYDNGGFVEGMDGKTLEYDVEGRLTKHVMGSTTMTYTYDGEGRRVKAEKSGTPAVVTTYVYGASGELVAEYGGAATGNGLTFLTADHLGSTRLVTNASGAAVSRHDYLPFGEEIPRGVGYGGGPPLMFTGQYRDVETNLDYFGARYMSSALGRFTSPDEPFADQDNSDPQSWNLYAYVRNNPLRNVDFNGRNCWQVTSSNGTVNYVDDGVKNTPTCSDYFKSTEQAGAHRVNVESDPSVVWNRSTGLAVLAEAGRRASDGTAIVEGYSAAQGLRAFWRNPIRYTISQFVPAPDTLPGFPTAKRSRPKTRVQGGGGMRKRWKDDDGNIYEWDSQHGTVEKYNRRGRHVGEFDSNTGKQTKPADPTRSVEP